MFWQPFSMHASASNKIVTKFWQADSIGWMATLSMCADTMGDTPSAHRPADYIYTYHKRSEVYIYSGNFLTFSW